MYELAATELKTSLSHLMSHWEVTSALIWCRKLNRLPLRSWIAPAHVHFNYIL